MIRAYKHPLYVQIFPDYEPRLQALIDRLQGYRAIERIDWRARIGVWLSNFAGLCDQRIALGMIERLRVVSDDEIVAGCSALLTAVGGALPRRARMSHFAHETSGGLLVRVLEKELKVRSFAVLRHQDFTNLAALGKLRDGDTVVIWDRFNGTGRQLRRLVRQYGKVFAQSGRKIGALHFAYIAGHRLSAPLPAGVELHLWIDDIPMVSPEEADLCTRYAEAAG